MGAARILRARWRLPLGAFLLLTGGTSYYLILGRPGISSAPGHNLAPWESRRGSVGLSLRGSNPESNKSIQSRSQSDIISEDYTVNSSTVPSSEASSPHSAWETFTQKIGIARDSFGSIKWSELGDDIKNYIAPGWASLLPDRLQKLQLELSMAPGSLAYDIWLEAQDVDMNPEIALDAQVRIGEDLCHEEQYFRGVRRQHVAKALASYLNLKEEDIHPDDIPVIAVCGSGGGLRALLAGCGSYLAAKEAGLWDCVTYTAGVSGSCWLQTLYYSSLGGQDFAKLVKHLKTRLGVHIAFPPQALNLLTTAPTNKYLLRGPVEKLKGDPDADFGLVDIYGLLLAARLLIPSGELDLSDQDLKLSSQRAFIDSGANPLPIYTAVRHEIPLVDGIDDPSSPAQRMRDALVEEAKYETWFQWFEFTPYELFCEELDAGIPIWALGRHFKRGKNVTAKGNLPVPELRIPMLLGLWGSAFCATLAHYYKEVRPVLKGLAVFGSIDALIEDKNGDLIRVHPIDPTTIPNFVVGLKDKLPGSCPASIFKDKHIRLMDAGVSNNLPIYPLLRPGRDIDIIIAFDASADIKEENWLSVVDGYARQRGIKGWPIGSGWPKPDAKPKETSKTLEGVASSTFEESGATLTEAKKKEHGRHQAEITFKPCENGGPPNKTEDRATHMEDLHALDLSYCNVWLGAAQEQTSTMELPPSKRLFHPPSQDYSMSDFHLMQPDAGIALVYFPLLSNPAAPTVNASSHSVPSAPTTPNKTSPGHEPTNPATIQAAGIDPFKDDFMSTWNFVYTPDQVDAVVGLAETNFFQGEDQVKRVVRGVYERKKRARMRKAGGKGNEPLQLLA